MSTKDKLKERFWNTPSDFTFDELSQALKLYGYKLYNRGKTSGSAVEFYNPSTKSKITIHKPHPGKIVKKYAIKIVQDALKGV